MSAAAPIAPSPASLLAAPVGLLQPLQSEPTTPVAGGPLAVVGTALLSWAFFTFTAQVSATFFLGDVPWRRAVIVGIVPAGVVTALIAFPPAVILVVALAADFAAFHVVYRLRYRTAALLTLGHAVASIALGIGVAYLVQVLSTAPA